jgi:hypothetical protein
VGRDRRRDGMLRRQRPGRVPPQLRHVRSRDQVLRVVRALRVLLLAPRQRRRGGAHGDAAGAGLGRENRDGPLRHRVRALPREVPHARGGDGARKRVRLAEAPLLRARAADAVSRVASPDCLPIQGVQVSAAAASVARRRRRQPCSAPGNSQPKVAHNAAAAAAAAH